MNTAKVVIAKCVHIPVSTVHASGFLTQTWMYFGMALRHTFGVWEHFSAPRDKVTNFYSFIGIAREVPVGFRSLCVYVCVRITKPTCSVGPVKRAMDDAKFPRLQNEVRACL
jgi:hypothetical protein